MIGCLQGVLLAKQAPVILLDVHGVGYEVEVSLRTFAALPELDHDLILYTHLLVREDMHSLYGFLELKERQLFRHLLKVTGVGAKMALAILSEFMPDELVHVILEGNVSRLTKVPGIGKKTAERLLIDMRDRIRDWELPTNPTKEVSRLPPVHQEALSALLALGYKEQEASRMLAKIDIKSTVDTHEVIRLALQQIAK